MAMLLDRNLLSMVFTFADSDSKLDVTQVSLSFYDCFVYAQLKTEKHQISLGNLRHP